VLTPIVRVLLEDLLDPESHGLDAGCLAGATQDMVQRMVLMPRYMGVGIAAMTLALGPLTRLPKARRVARWDSFRGRPLVGDFVEFYEKMGTFTYYTRVEHGA